MVIFLIWALAVSSFSVYLYMENNKLNRQVQSLKNQVESLTKENAMLYDQISSLNNQMSNLESQNTNLSNELFTLQNRIRMVSYVTLIIDYSNGSIDKYLVYIIEGKNNTVFDVLKAVAVINYTYYEAYNDVLIWGINGVYNNDKECTYWLFYVNGVLSPTGAMNTYIYGGDRIVWNYTKISW